MPLNDMEAYMCSDFFKFDGSKRISIGEFKHRFDKKSIDSFNPQLKQILNIFDYTKDGKLEVDELEVNSFFYALKSATNGDNILTFEEFNVFLSENKVKIDNPKKLYNEFKTYFSFSG